MTFLEQQNAIINYLETNIPTADIVNDFLDFDKYKSNSTIFIDFSRIDFRTSNYDDECGDIESLLLTLYTVRRNDTPINLQNSLLSDTWSLYRLIKNKPDIGVAQNTTIQGIDFYRYVEGNKYLVCSEISLLLEIEI